MGCLTPYESCIGCPDAYQPVSDWFEVAEEMTRGERLLLSSSPHRKGQ